MADHCGWLAVARVCSNEIHRRNMRGQDEKVYRGLNGAADSLLLAQRFLSSGLDMFLNIKLTINTT